MYKIELEQTEAGVVATLMPGLALNGGTFYMRMLTSDPCETIWDAFANLREKYVRSIAKVGMMVKCGDFGKETTIIQILKDIVVTSRGTGQTEAWKFSEIKWIEGMDEVFPKH